MDTDNYDNDYNRMREILRSGGYRVENGTNGTHTEFMDLQRRLQNARMTRERQREDENEEHRRNVMRPETMTNLVAVRQGRLPPLLIQDHPGIPRQFITRDLPPTRLGVRPGARQDDRLPPLIQNAHPVIPQQQAIQQALGAQPTRTQEEEEDI